jgi:putative endonuclease
MPYKNKNIEIGKKGENMAVDYLKELNYDIVSRNFRYGRIEIDIIAKHQNVLVFIEVKTRSSGIFGFPEESVDEAKQESIQECAEEYIYRENWEGEIRFDIIAINLEETPRINHIRDAF